MFRSWISAERVSPAEPWKPCIVMIGRYPFTTEFDRQRRMIGIADKISTNVGLVAQLGENCPVPPSGRKHRYVRVFSHLPDIFESVC